MTKICLAALVSIGLCAAGVPRARAADTELKAGMKAPAFKLPSQSNKTVGLSDFKGKWVVLYFYPKDKSIGCTIQAHTYQRDLSKFKASDTVILGVSMDTVASHKSFRADDGLTFRLLADPERKVASEYGVPALTYHNMKFDERDTILIAPNGKIVQIRRNVDPRTDSTIVLAEIRKLNGQ